MGETTDPFSGMYNMIHLNNGLLFSDKELSCQTSEDTWKFKCVLLSERCQPEKVHYCNDFNSMTYGKGRSYRHSKMISGCWGLLRGRNELAEHEDLGGTLIFLYDSMMMNACHYTFYPNHKFTRLRANHKVNHGLGVIMTHQGRFMKLKNDTILLQMLIVEKPWVFWRQGVLWDLCTSQFLCEITTAL